MSTSLLWQADKYLEAELGLGIGDWKKVEKKTVLIIDEVKMAYHMPAASKFWQSIKLLMQTHDEASNPKMLLLGAYGE